MILRYTLERSFENMGNMGSIPNDTCIASTGITTTTGEVALQQKIISHSSGGWKPQIEVLAGFGSGGGSLAASSLVLTWSFLQATMQRERNHSLPLILRPPIQLDQGPTLMT